MQDFYDVSLQDITDENIGRIHGLGMEHGLETKLAKVDKRDCHGENGNSTISDIIETESSRDRNRQGPSASRLSD
jgi:hypothetical protein